MVGTPRSHKNVAGKTTNGLYLGSKYCRDVSTNDDRSLGNEKRRSIWERKRNKTTNKKRKSSYTDVEKEIEKATAATLEGFVAMKTKPIHNSVKQRADRAVIGVKSVIGWFRTGGKKK